MPLSIRVKTEQWPIEGVFTISRGSKTIAEVIVVEIRDAAQEAIDPATAIVGRGEGVPYRHYNETIEGSVASIQAVVPALSNLPVESFRQQLLSILPNGAARNAVDCAMWDFECKLAGKRPWELHPEFPAPKSLTTAYTLSLDTVEKMAAAAAKNAHRPLLKLKLATEDDLYKVEAIRANAPHSRLIVDANEGWTPEVLERLAPKLAALNVELVEQPLPATKDISALTGRRYAISVCADESLRDIALMPELAACYTHVNIKLDKSGGLTHALEQAATARRLGLKIMVGCMVCTSLAIAPAAWLASAFDAEFVDLDGPLLLHTDRNPGVVYEGSTLVQPCSPALWG
ncbi:dipeptide epimerase [Pelomyxa schiedti]|nr:dipeptide epimerase [Pelomyxa schiedti]